MARPLGEVGAHKTEVVVVVVVIVAVCCLICMLFVSFQGLVECILYIFVVFIRFFFGIWGTRQGVKPARAGKSRILFVFGFLFSFSRF